MRCSRPSSLTLRSGCCEQECLACGRSAAQPRFVVSPKVRNQNRRDLLSARTRLVVAELVHAVGAGERAELSWMPTTHAGFPRPQGGDAAPYCIAFDIRCTGQR